MENNWIDDLRNAVNIVDVVGEYVALRQKGHRHWACCPFHNEKTPSFEVDERSQLYYCFGCHKGGNVFSFVMELEHMEFIDAAKLLAERVGFEIPERASAGPAVTTGQRMRAYDCNRAAALYYHRTLYSEEGTNTLAYLHKRGLDDQTIRRFGLGSTPLKSGSLLMELKRQGFTDDEMYLAGLTRDRERGRDELFFERAMFPIINPQGRVLGFGGRVMAKREPKYLNTADTIIFNKRRELYGLNMVKKQSGLDRLILVEGYMDVVSLAQHGVAGVVATLGTALTADQVELIARRVPRVYLAYDGDEPGQNAIARAIDMFRGKETELRVLRFPDGRDPDEFVREFGREAFDALPALTPTEWLINRAEGKSDLSTQEGRTKFAIDAMAELAKLQNPVEREAYLPELAIKTGFDRDTLKAQLTVAEGDAALRAQSEATRRTYRRAQADNDDVYIRAERLLLLLAANGLCPADALNPDEFMDEFNRTLCQALTEGKTPSAILDDLEPEQRDRAAGIFQSDTPISQDTAARTLADCATTLRRRRLESEVADIKARIPTTQGEELKDLLRHFNTLTQELSRLKSGRKE